MSANPLETLGSALTDDLEEPEAAVAHAEAKIIPEALAQFVSVTIAPVATGLGVLYLLFAVAHFFLQTGIVRAVMPATALISAALLLTIATVLRRHPPHHNWAHFWVAVIAGFVLFNSWLHMGLARDLLQSTNFMLLIVGTGFFFLSSPWFFGFLLLTLGAWGGAIFLFEIPAAENLVHFIFGLLSASLLALLAHNARRARLIRLTRLHYRDRESAIRLEAALASSSANEAALRSSEARYRQLSLQLEEQAEALRVANQSLASASKLKDEFLASMSHELRTPLTAILGITESLKEQIYGPISERQLRALGNVLESGNHLLELINDVLDVAKTEAGKLELDIVLADVQMVAEASVRFVQQSATAKQITITFEVDTQIGLLLADERRLKQMLINLLNNAVKFTGEGGQVGLNLTGERNNRIVRFTVWDTGIGIRADQMSRLFKPFIQLDSRLSRSYGGTGLGLVLVYRMAEMHGGSVTVESCPDQGSRFTIRLPWRTADFPPPATTGSAATQSPPTNGDNATTAAVHPPTATPTMLVIDDHHWSRKWITAVAKAAGYVASAMDGEGEMLQTIAQMQPALLLIDLQLPPHDTLALMRTLRKEPATCAIPIVAMSALAMPGEEDEAKAAGADAYVVKPVSVAQLREIVTPLVNGEATP